MEGLRGQDLSYRNFLRTSVIYNPELELHIRGDYVLREENLQKIIELRHELHEYPELSGHETHTKRRLMDFIEANTDLAVVDCGKWFYASRYVEGTRAIAFRADMDALPIDEGISLPYASRNPGVSHKCGHDGHCAALCGFGLELPELERRRSVYLIFQHSEETGAGARECASLLRERNITEIYAFHNWSGFPENSIVVRAGLCQCASTGLTVKFTGKESHASEPEKGINPAHSVALLIFEAENLCGKFTARNLWYTVININLGDKNFGMSPADAEVSLTLRAEREQDMRDFAGMIRAKASEIAHEHGLAVSFSECDYFPETVSYSDCVHRVKTAAKTLGLNVIDMPEAIRASEDFGHYTKEIPGTIFYVGNGENYPAIHTKEYDFNDNILGTAADMFTGIYKRSLI